VQRAGWAGVHGAVFTITKEDGGEYNLLAFDDFSREPVEGEIKQGTGDLCACGPSTFTSVDSFIKHGEDVPMRDTLCASINAIAVNKIDQTEIMESKENVHANANTNEKKSVEIEIDLEKEMIKSSTTNESIAAEQDFIINAEPLDTANPIDNAEPVNTGDSDEKIDSLDQYVINLCQTISCNDTTLNIGYDSGATVTLVSEKVAEMNIEKENTKYILDTVGGKDGLKGSDAVRILLAMKNGGMHVLNALVTDKLLGKVAALPPHSDVEKILAVPKEKLADRRGGEIDILVGRDNAHFFPQDLDSPQGTDSGMRLFRAVLGKGVMYAGSVRGVPGEIAPPVSTKSKSLDKNLSS
jgi:hypothetical protein